VLVQCSVCAVCNFLLCELLQQEQSCAGVVCQGGWQNAHAQNSAQIAPQPPGPAGACWDGFAGLMWTVCGALGSPVHRPVSDGCTTRWLAQQFAGHQARHLSCSLQRMTA
jgi:hypothetical protein